MALTLRKDTLRYHFAFFANVAEITIASLVFMKQKLNRIDYFYFDIAEI